MRDSVANLSLLFVDFLIPNSEVAKLCGKKPLTWLATLATLSPRERADINDR
jgi:hypothetical protein